MNTEVFGNSIWRWFVALLVFAVIYIGLRFATVRVIKRLQTLAEKTRSVVDDIGVGVFAGTTRMFFAVLALLGSTSILQLGSAAQDIRRWMVVIGVTVQVGIWGQRAIRMWLDDRRARLSEHDPGALTTLQGLSYLAQTALWTAVVVLMLDNLGYNVSALVAGLGIGGVAVALALQNVLGDLFASLSITLDKPFVTGDFIIVDDKLGVVSKVGLKTTRVTSLSGEQLVFSNSDLLSSRIQNFKKMQERRVAFSIGVVYQTPVEKLELIPTIVRDIVDGIERTRFDRAHFKSFGDSAYIFEIVYYVLEQDYEVFMDCQQRLNLELCRQFEDRDIEFAYPTRTLHLASDTGPLSIAGCRSET